MLKAVIFDMDGVLVDTESIFVDIEKKIFSELGIDVGPELAASFLGMTSYGMWKILKDEFNLEQSPDDLADLNSQRFFDELMNMDLEPMSGVESFIEELLYNKIEVALATSATRRRMELILGKLKMDGIFSDKVCADDIVNGKPDPEVFLKAAGKIGVPAGDCVVIEDSKNGVLAANSAGMKSVGLKSSPIVQDFSMADLVVDSFGELSVQKLRGLW